MIKNLLFAATAFVAISMSANAQTIVLDEDFEDSGSWTENDAWIVSNASSQTTGGSLNWGLYNAASFADNGFNTIKAASSSFYTIGEGEDAELFPYAVDNYFISPVISIPENESQVILTFDEGAFLGDGASLLLSIIAGINEEGSEEHVVYTNTFSASTTAANSVTVDMSEYDFGGEDIYFAFRHNGSSGLGYVIIDNVVVTSSTSGSTDNFAKLGLNVFPNPVSDIVNITSPEANIEMVTITDLNGRTVKSINFNNVAETTIDASDLASGIYLMNITANGTVATQKIVKK